MQPYEKEHEKEVFKGLSFKDKLDHIWTYYKMPIIIGAIALFVLGWCINRFILNPPPVNDGVVIVYSSFDDSVALKELRTDINEHFAPSLADNHDIAIQSLTNYGDNIIYYEQQKVNLEKIVAMIAAKELDILISSESMVNTFAIVDGEKTEGSSMMYLCDLIEVFSAEELKYIEECGFTFNDFSICVKGENTHLFNVMERNAEIPYMVFTYNCDRDISRLMAYYFMNIEPLNA